MTAQQHQTGFVPWEQAWQQALYGPDGFYRRPEGPAGHFRTASHAAGPELAVALHRLARDQGCSAIVDVGAGRGELLTALAGLALDDPDDGLRLFGVDVVPRPPALPPNVGWARTTPPTDSTADHTQLPDQALAGALVICWELLDVVPCPILELDDDGQLRLVLIERSTGRETLGDVAEPADQRWCERWWPANQAHRQHQAQPGDRFEVGRTRDEFWATLIRRSISGGARAMLAVDYCHHRDARPPTGSLTGFRAGRAVPPRPDGSMDLTAHVALDAVAAALERPGPAIVEQHVALRALGVRDGELLDPGGLGGFGWLLLPLVRSSAHPGASSAPERQRSAPLRP